MSGVRRGRWLSLIAVTLLAATVVPGSAGAQSDERTITIISTNRVPIVDIVVSGVTTATIEGDPSGFTISWSFRGISGGGPANASGSGFGTWVEGSDTMNVTLTSIDQWSIPGFPQPAVPKSATVDRLGFFFAFVDVSDSSIGPLASNIPMRVTPRMSNPFGGLPFRVVSSFGTGSTTIDTLPGARSRATPSFPRRAG